MNVSINPVTSPSIGQYFDAVRRRWPAALLVVVASSVAAAIVASNQDQNYVATGSVYLTTGPATPGGVPTDASRTISSAVKLATSDSVLESVAKDVGGVGLDSLRSGVAVTSADLDGIVTVTATFGTQRQATTIGSAVVKAFVDYWRSLAPNARLAAVTQELDDVPRGPQYNAARARLQSLREVLGAQVDAYGIRVVHEVRAAADTTRPPATAAVLGAVGGALLALVVVALLEVFDPRARRIEDIERATNLPVAAEVDPGNADEEFAALDVQVVDAALGTLLVVGLTEDDSSGIVASRLASWAAHDRSVAQLDLVADAVGPLSPEQARRLLEERRGEADLLVVRGGNVSEHPSVVSVGMQVERVLPTTRLGHSDRAALRKASHRLDVVRPAATVTGIVVVGSLLPGATTGVTTGSHARETPGASLAD